MIKFIKTKSKNKQQVFLSCLLFIIVFLFNYQTISYASAYTATIPGTTSSTTEETKNSPVTEKNLLPADENASVTTTQSSTIPAYFPTKAVEKKRTLGLADFLNSFLFLLAIVALIMMLAWVFKRTGLTPGLGNQVIKVVSAIPIGQKEKIALIEVGNQQLLIGVTPGNIQKLLILDTPIKVDDKNNNSSNSLFSAQLFKYLNKNKNAK
jgi:flagellar biosynthetic protein FliO